MQFMPILTMLIFLFHALPKYQKKLYLQELRTVQINLFNENKLCTGIFSWQDSASAFSVSKSDVDKVCQYILNQPEHHKKISFQKEYDDFIKFYQKTLKWE